MITNGDMKLPDEFASTMQQLVAEAAKTIPPQKLAADQKVMEADEMRGELGAVNQRLAALENALTSGLDKITAALPPGTDADQMQRIDEHLVALRKTESVNQRLFNSLHQELISYRDNFLRESLQKPFIRDLVVLFDDLNSLASQLEKAAGTGKKPGAVQQWSENLRNAIHSLVEVLHRMEVNEIEPKEMVDRALHRVVSYEPADFAEDDGRIVMRVKRGFVWRDQVLRPEEVVAKRFS